MWWKLIELKVPHEGRSNIHWTRNGNQLIQSTIILHLLSRGRNRDVFVISWISLSDGSQNFGVSERQEEFGLELRELSTVRSSSNFQLPLVLMNEFAQIVCDFDGIGYCSQWNWCILSMVAEWFNLKHQQNLNNANYCIFQCRNASWILSIVCSSSKMSLRSIQTAHATKFNGEYFYNSLADNSVPSK